MAESNEQKIEIIDLSGGVQIKTTRFLQKDNELSAAENSSFEEIGGIGKKLGYVKQGNDATSTTSTSTSSSTTSTSTSSSTSSSTSTSTTTTA
jgi:hypothetical protein